MYAQYSVVLNYQMFMLTTSKYYHSSMTSNLWDFRILLNDSPVDKQVHVAIKNQL